MFLRIAALQEAVPSLSYLQLNAASAGPKQG